MSPAVLALAALCVLLLAGCLYLWMDGRAWRARALEADSLALGLQAELHDASRPEIRRLETFTVDPMTPGPRSQR